MSEFVRIHEVGPRDGLQNEPRVIPIAQKLALINMLARSGLPHVEVGSFVSPKWVPQMADSDRIVTDLPADPAVTYAVLVPNLRGWLAFDAVRKPDTNYEVAVFVSATEGFSQKNLNCSIAESLERAAPVVSAAAEAGVDTRAYVSCITDCPYDGAVRPGQVIDVVQRLRRLADMPVSLGDTIGKATPERLALLLEEMTQVVPATELAGHFHDTGGLALQNIALALDYGLRDFDSAVGGLGGCPYAPGAPGNVATEAVLTLLDNLGYETGVDPGVIAEAAVRAEDMR